MPHFFQHLPTKRAAAGAHFGMWAYAFATGAMGALLPAVSSSLHFAPAKGKTIFLLHGIGFLCGLLWVRRAFFSNFPQRLFWAGGLGAIASLFAWTQSSSLPFLSATFFFFGLMGSWFETGINALISRLYPENKAGALTFLHASFGIGAWAGPKGMELWLGTGGYWAWCLVPSMALMGIALILVPLKNPSEESAAGTTPPPATAQPYRMPLIAAVVVVSYIAAEMTLSNWAPSVFKVVWKLSDGEAAGTIGGFWLWMGIGRVICGLLSQRVNTRVMLLGTAALSTLAMAFMMAAPTAPFAVLALSLTGLAYSGALALAMAIAQEENPGHLERATAFLVAALGLGLVTGPPLAGQIADWYGLNAVLWTALGLNLIFLAASLMLWRPRPGS